jgi:hypothetical protein
MAGRVPSPRFIVEDQRALTRWKLVALYGLAMLPRIWLVATGQIFHWSAYREGEEFAFLLSVLGDIPVFVTSFLLVVGLQRRDRIWLLTGLMMLLCELAWGVLSGSRVRMFLPLVSSLAALSYLGRPFGMRSFAMVLAAFVLVIFPFSTAFRGAYFERSEVLVREGVGVSTLIDAVSDATQSDEPTELTDGDGPLESLAERLHGLTSLALIIRYTPERHEYYLGVPYLLVIPQILIPRFVWPDKPAMAPFTESFRYDYWGLEPGSGTMVATSQLGDLWVNLHVFGALAGSFFFAAFMAFAFRHLRFGIAGDSIFPVVVFAAHLTAFLHALEGAVDGAVAGLVKSFLVYFLIAWFLSRGRQARER